MNSSESSREAWTVAGLGLLCTALSSPGQSFALSLYLDPLMADAGISRLAISTIYSGATLAAAVTLAGAVFMTILTAPGLPRGAGDPAVDGQAAA